MLRGRIKLSIFLLIASLFAATITAVRPQTANPTAPGKRGANTQSLVPRPTPTPVEPDAEVIRVETDLVNTLFTAVDRDRHFITSLRAQDVAVFEDNVAQTVSLFERETNRPLSLVLLVDTSESQRGILSDEKGAAREFIEAVVRPDRDHAAIISFTGVPKVEQGPTNDLAKLHGGIQQVRIEMSPENARRLANGEDPLPKDQDPSGYTGIWDAMWTSIDVLAKTPQNTRRAIVLLSDGDDTSSSIKKQEVIDRAVKEDVVIYAIGLRDQNFPEGKLDSGALRKVTDHTGGRAFFPSQRSELPAAFTQLETELRSQYVIAYSPSNKNRDGTYRRVRIEVVNPALRKDKAQLLYRSGYYARKS